MTSLQCPFCGGVQLTAIAPGLWRCDSEVSWDEPAPVGPGGQVIGVRRTRICSREFQTGGQSTLVLGLCRCNTAAIGLCSACSAPVCGVHSGIDEDRRICAWCWPTQTAAGRRDADARAALERKQELQDRVWRTVTTSTDPTNLLAAAKMLRAPIALDGLSSFWPNFLRVFAPPPKFELVEIERSVRGDESTPRITRRHGGLWPFNVKLNRGTWADDGSPVFDAYRCVGLVDEAGQAWERVQKDADRYAIPHAAELELSRNRLRGEDRRRQGAKWWNATLNAEPLGEKWILESEDVVLVLQSLATSYGTL